MVILLPGKLFAPPPPFYKGELKLKGGGGRGTQKTQVGMLHENFKYKNYIRSSEIKSTLIQFAKLTKN